MAPLLKEVGLVLLFLSPALAKSLSTPRLRSNATLNIGQPALQPASDLNLAPRYYTCDAGYAQCSLNTLYCCPTGDGCCSTGYCTEPGDTCCTIGTCPSGWDCCGNNGHCSPTDGQCCEDGSYCESGYSCELEYGAVVCCPSSGCGSDGSGDLGSTNAIDSVTVIQTTSYYTPVYTYDTYTYETYADLQYYYTTYYWTFWFYFWTSYAPYTVQTVTSTETTTTTIWSIYASNSAEATASLSLSVEEYSFSTPYEATYLSGFTGSAYPVSTTPTATYTGLRAGGGDGIKPGAATAVKVGSWVPWAIIAFTGLMGALAVGL